MAVSWTLQHRKNEQQKAFTVYYFEAPCQSLNDQLEYRQTMKIDDRTSHYLRTWKQAGIE